MKQLWAFPSIIAGMWGQWLLILTMPIKIQQAIPGGSNAVFNLAICTTIMVTAIGMCLFYVQRHLGRMEKTDGS